MLKYCVNTKMLNDEFSLIEKIKFASKEGFHGIEPWFYEIQNSKDILNCSLDYGVEIPSFEAIQGVMERDFEILNVLNENNIKDECKRRFELADQINAKYVIIAPPFSHRGFTCSLETSLERYNDLYTFCVTNFKCEPVLEFMGQTKLIYNYNTCKQFLDTLKTPNTKMIIDAYHLWRSGDAMDSFLEYENQNIALFHISDACKGIEKTLHRDRDRVIPLDGQIDLCLFANTIKQKQYKGFISVGVYNPEIAKQCTQSNLLKTKRNLDTLFKL